MPRPPFCTRPHVSRATLQPTAVSRPPPSALTTDANRGRLTAAGYPERIVDMLAANTLPVKTLQPVAASLLNLVNDGHGKQPSPQS